jgi:peroxiredoxin
MKKRTIIPCNILLILLILIMSNCSPSGKKDRVQIKGRFVFSRGEMVYLREILAYDKTTLDSARLNENGEFEFSVPVKDVSIFWIGTSEDNYLTLICEKGEKTEITGDIRSLPATYSVSGSPASDKVLELHKFTLSNYVYFDTLSSIWEKRKYDNGKMLLRDSLDSIALTVYQSQKDYVLKFINENMQSLSAIMALYQVFGRVSVLDEFEYIELYEKTADVLRVKYPTNQHVNELSARVAKNKLTMKENEEIVKRLQPGNPVPELSLPDKDGKPISVGELKGSTVLIYFWSATSPPSRKMNQELVRIHRQFASKGFTLYTVSLDNNTDNWKKAVELDKLPGFHVNDQRSLSSPVFKMFNFSDLPHSILVDNEGIIIGSGLTADEINVKLYELLPQQRNAATVQ